MSEQYKDCTDKCWRPVVCATCGNNKQPVGRDAGLMRSGDCNPEDCPGYREDPHPPHFWSEREFKECTTGIVEADDE